MNETAVYFATIEQNSDVLTVILKVTSVIFENTLFFFIYFQSQKQLKKMAPWMLCTDDFICQFQFFFPQWIIDNGIQLNYSLLSSGLAIPRPRSSHTRANLGLRQAFISFSNIYLYHKGSYIKCEQPPIMIFNLE